MKRETLATLNEARRAGKIISRAVDLDSGEEYVVDPVTDRSMLGVSAATGARADRSGPVEIDGRSWFIETYNPPLDLAIVGAVHIAQPLAQIAALAGYRVRILDPRTAFATEERFPGHAISHDWPDDALAKAPLGTRSALVALAHDPKLDDPALSAALRSPCFYIGALGSKKSHARRIDRLAEQGFTQQELARIHGPVGLAIFARSPAEIAISILAEMTLELRADGGWEHSSARTTADTGSTPRS